MGWDTIAQLVLTNGVQLAYVLWQKWSTGNPPTQADWDEILLVAGKTSEQYFIDALNRANISPDSEAGKKLIESYKAAATAASK